MQINHQNLYKLFLIINSMILEQRIEESKSFFANIKEGYKEQTVALRQGNFYFTENIGEDIGSSAAVFLNLHYALISVAKDIKNIYDTIRKNNP